MALDPALAKTPSGILGLDEITHGGFPKGRTSLITGSAGSGKTLMGLEFIVKGATRYNEPGLFVSFEETEEELTRNVASLGFDLQRLIHEKKLILDYVHIERSEIEETGEYDLEGLFVRLGYAIDQIGAKRVVLDTLEALFSGLPNEAILRAELRRLFRWLKRKGVTAIITGERGENSLISRYGLEEYVADCVLVLDHRVVNQISTRRLRVVKYRGSEHGTNEYPFLISNQGVSVLPITSLNLTHQASSQRVSTGVEQLDAMFGGKGYYRGSSILVTGAAGTGKSSLAAAFAKAGCERGERVVYFAFEESPEQIMRNMRSIGIDLQPYVKSGLLEFHAARPTLHGLEMHLLNISETVRLTKPRLAVFDPITNLMTVGNDVEVRAMLTRVIDLLKSHQITSLFTSLSSGEETIADTEIGVSSLMDTWLLLRNLEQNGERNRGLYALKSRGMSHSNQVREFVLSDHGIQLLDVYAESGHVLTGSARLAEEARRETEARNRKELLARRRREVQRKQRALEAQIAVLETQLDAEAQELAQTLSEENFHETEEQRAHKALLDHRMAHTEADHRETAKRPHAPRRRSK